MPFSNWTRREFLGTSLKVGAVVSTVPVVLQGQDSTEDGATATRGPNIEGAVPITLRINGKDRQLIVDPRTTLLDCLRETVALTGTKKGCDHGQCGACTVHVNGGRVNSCLSLALMHDGEEITTIATVETPAAQRAAILLLLLQPSQAARNKLRTEL